MKLAIKKIQPDAILPSYAHQGDAGFDIYALKNTIVAPHERVVISTGISMEIPHGYVGLVWDKSGIATKHGIKTIAGVIDAGYRGEVGIAVLNTSDVPYTFEAGHKVAQMLIQKIEHVDIVEVSELSDTSRGTGGFGSTGK